MTDNGIRTFSIEWFHDEKRLQHSHSMEVLADSLNTHALMDVRQVMHQDDQNVREALAVKTDTDAAEWRTVFHGFTEAEEAAMARATQ